MYFIYFAKKHLFEMEIYFKKCFKCVLIEYKYLFKKKKKKL